MATMNLLAQLRNLHGKAGPLVFERASVAAKLLADAQWIAAEHGGDESKARDVLEDDYFGDIGLTLGQLLQVHRAFPDVTQWRVHKFSLSRLWAAYQETKQTEKKESKASGENVRVGPISNKLYQEALDRVKHFEAVAKKQETDAKKVMSEAEKLRQRCAELERDNIRLQARVDELERMMDRQFARAGAA